MGSSSSNHSTRSAFGRSASVTPKRSLKSRTRIEAWKMTTLKSQKSQSLTQVTLSTVEGHAVKRRRVDYPGTLQRYNTEIISNPRASSSVSTTSPTTTRVLAPASTLPAITSSSSSKTTSTSTSTTYPNRLEDVQTASQLSLARRSPSPVPTELDIDNAERPDIDAHLYNVHKVKVIDYASNPPAKNFPSTPSTSTSTPTVTDFASTSGTSRLSVPSRIPEAFFAKDAMAQYEWFMARGSREWDQLSQQGTEVWEENDDKEERTRTEDQIRQSQSPAQNQNESPAQSSPRRGQPLRRQQRVPLTGIKLFNEEPRTESLTLSTPPTSSAKPTVSDQEKTPLLPSFSPRNPLAPRTMKLKRTAPIPGRVLYRLHEIQWVTDEEAHQRWLPCDWEEFHAHEMREREKFKDGKRGYMGKGEVGYPYWAVWGSPPSPRNTKGKEKAKEPEPQKQPEPEPEPETEAVPDEEEEIVESQSIHATLSGTLESPQQSPEPEAAVERSASPSPSPPVEQSQSMHVTLSGTIKTPRNSPSPPSGEPIVRTEPPPTPPKADPPSPAKQSSPKKSIASALAAELYYLALAEDTDLGFGKPPSREYRRALGERAGDVWIWLGEYVKRWGRVTGFGKKEGQNNDPNKSESLFESFGKSGGGGELNNNNGSGRVLGMNTGTLGRTRTLGGLGRTTTLRDLGRANTLDGASREQQKKQQPDNAKMDVDVPTPTTSPLTPEEDDPMDVNSELETSSIRSTIGSGRRASTEEAQPEAGPSVPRARASSRARRTKQPQVAQPADEAVEESGRVTRSAAQRANKRTKDNPPVMKGPAEDKEAPKKRTRTTTSKATSASSRRATTSNKGKGKGKARVVETEPEADVEMMDGEGDTSVGDEEHSDGESRARSGVKITTRKSKRKIDKVELEDPASMDVKTSNDLSGSDALGADEEYHAGAPPTRGVKTRANARGSRKRRGGTS
ncbi:hypothetical protein PQX77_018995 [Marasmius sp. AFHP31]|nr:hypothetical protein PQX77_018995 [Marasmius sp. AFHP31]